MPPVTAALHLSFTISLLTLLLLLLPTHTVAFDPSRPPPSYRAFVHRTPLSPIAHSTPRHCHRHRPASAPLLSSLSGRHKRTLQGVFCGSNDSDACETKCSLKLSNRRSVLSFMNAFFISQVGPASSCASLQDDVVTSPKMSRSNSAAESSVLATFHSAASGSEEYTNSLTASRDTNISPREVYDTIASDYLRFPLSAVQNKKDYIPNALDVGAGAGVSTEILWTLGYRRIDAVDWSSKAWDRFVVDDPAGVCPPSVSFYELDDERYLEQWRSQGRARFDVIVFNFAVNESKARQFCKELLQEDYGRLLAPVNTLNDYWLRQTYKVFDSKGKVLWSAGDVGAWSVLFQPDVTAETCQGIWCAPFNGFQKKR